MRWLWWSRAGARPYGCQGGWTWLKQTEQAWLQQMEACDQSAWVWVQRRLQPQSEAHLWIRDRKPRVHDWEGQARVSPETEVVKSLQVGKAPFGEVPRAASKGLTAWGGHSVTLETSALTPSLPLVSCVYHSGFSADHSPNPADNPASEANAANTLTVATTACMGHSTVPDTTPSRRFSPAPAPLPTSS